MNTRATATISTIVAALDGVVDGVAKPVADGRGISRAVLVPSEDSSPERGQTQDESQHELEHGDRPIRSGGIAGEPGETRAIHVEVKGKGAIDAKYR